MKSQLPSIGTHHGTDYASHRSRLDVPTFPRTVCTTIMGNRFTAPIGDPSAPLSLKGLCIEHPHLDCDHTPSLSGGEGGEEEDERSGDERIPKNICGRSWKSRRLYPGTYSSVPRGPTRANSNGQPESLRPKGQSSYMYVQTAVLLH